MTITINALKEKIRRKELYVVAVLGLLLVILFSSGAGTLTIDGEPITGYGKMAPIMIVVVNALSGALAIALSIRTIPNEYERKTSHLIWIRDVKQWQYHGYLSLANIISSLIAALIMYLGLFIFAVIKQETQGLYRLIPAFFIMAIGVCIVSLFTSVLSIVLPGMAVGIISAGCFLVGIFHGVLEIAKDMVGGFTGGIISVLLKIIPNLNELQAQAGNMIGGEAVNSHEIFKGLLIIYILTLLFFVFKRKEA
ncbi:MAG: hypothetical protein IJF03_07440 [Lachnospiraceae bacterium]|nr:hypothetical protein [Lachnospiraceae bacterium]